MYKKARVERWGCRSLQYKHDTSTDALVTRKQHDRGNHYSVKGGQGALLTSGTRNWGPPVAGCTIMSSSASRRSGVPSSSPHVMKGESSTPGVKVGVASTEYSPVALCAAAGEGESVLEGVSPLSVVAMIRVPLRLICFGGPW